MYLFLDYYYDVHTYPQECLQADVAVVTSAVQIVLEDAIKCQLSRKLGFQQTAVVGVSQSLVQEAAEVRVISPAARQFHLAPDHMGQVVLL